MRLNIGSGTHPTDLPGWVNIDLGGQAHVYADALALPFRHASAKAVYLGHVLEHLRWEDELPAMLREVRRIMAPGAPCMVVGPDIERAVSTGQPTSLLLRIIRGGERAPDAHQWVATESQTVRALEMAGFSLRSISVATVTRPAWPNPSTAPWQFALEAR